MIINPHLIPSFLIFLVLIYLIRMIGRIAVKKFYNTTENKKFVNSFIFEFGIGYIFFIIYSYIILTLRIFNFYTIYLPLLVIIFIYFVFKWKNRKMLSKTDYSKKIKTNIMNYKADIIILLIIFIFQYFLQMSFLESYVTFPSFDPYLWTQNVFSLLRDSYIKPEYAGAHLQGFVLFCSTALLPFQDYYRIYFFMKYVPFFLACFNIYIVYQSFKRVFRNKFYLFFSLMMILSMNHIFYRYSMPLPTLLATTISLIFLKIIQENNMTVVQSLSKNACNEIQNEDNLNSKLNTERNNNSKLSINSIIKKLREDNIVIHSLLLASIFLTHFFSGLLILSFYIMYELFEFVINYNTNNKKENKEQLNKKDMFFYFFIKLMLTGIIWILGISIFIIHVSSIFSFQVLIDSYFGMI